jgi:hypothetical protein
MSGKNNKQISRAEPQRTQRKDQTKPKPSCFSVLCGFASLRENKKTPGRKSPPGVEGG